MSDRVELPRAESCSTCRFWVFQSDGKGGGPMDPLEDADTPWGFCRRYPPRADESNHEERDDYNCPRTSDTFWCGEYQPTVAPPAPPVG